MRIIFGKKKYLRILKKSLKIFLKFKKANRQIFNKKIRKIDFNNNNDNKIKIDKICNTHLLPITNNEYISENACYENEKIQKKSHSINEINIELNDQKNNNFIYIYNKISDEPKYLKSIDSSNKNKSENEENNQMINESFSFFLRIKNAFLYWI